MRKGSCKKYIFIYELFLSNKQEYIAAGCGVRGYRMNGRLYMLQRNNAGCQLSVQQGFGSQHSSGIWGSRMEECVSHAQGVETQFPVCISCVSAKGQSLFPVCDGCQAQDPDTKTTCHESPPMSETGQAASTDQDSFKCLYIHNQRCKVQKV